MSKSITYRKYTIKYFSFPNFRQVIFLWGNQDEGQVNIKGHFLSHFNISLPLDQLFGKKSVARPILNQAQRNSPAWRIIYTFAIT